MANNENEVKVTFKAFNNDFNKSVSEMNKEASKLRQEMKLQEEQLKLTGTETQKLESKLSGLGKSYDIAKNKTAATAEQLAKAKALWGENSAEAQKLETQLKRAQIAEQQVANSIQETTSALNQAKQAQQDQSDSLKKLNTLFDATSSSIDDYVSTLGKDLVNAIKNGTASSQQLDDAINKIGKEALGASTDLDKMKQSLADVDNGGSIDKVKKELQKISDEAEKAEKSIGSMGTEIENVAGALVAGGGLAGAVETALDVSSLNTKIDISMEVPEESKQSVKDAINIVTSYGVDAESALEGVRKQWALNKDASDEANAAVIQGAGTIAATYSGIDFNELIQETNEISKTLGITNEQALGLTNSLLKTGFPPDQIDIIAEYGTQLKMAGYNAGEIQALFAAGVDTGTWNIDNLMDGLKEGRIQMAEFTTSMTEDQVALAGSIDGGMGQFDEWASAIVNGGEQGSQAMREVAEMLNGIEDQTRKNELGVMIFGTMYEDQGQNIIDTLLNAKGATADLKKGQDSLNEANSKLNSDPAVKLAQAWKDLKEALAPVLSVIASAVSAFASLVTTFPGLSAFILTIGSAIGILGGSFFALQPIIQAISTALPKLSLIFGKIVPIVTRIIAFMPSLGAVFTALTGPIGIAIAAIAAIIAIAVLVVKNWEPIKEFFINLWNKTVEIFKAAGTAILNFLKENWQTILAVLTGPIGLLVLLISRNWDKIKKITTTLATSVVNKITELKTNTVNKFKELVTQAVTKITELKTNVVKKITELKTSAQTKISELKTAIVNKFVEIKTQASNKVSEMKNAIVNKFLELKKSISDKMTDIKLAIQSGWNRAKAFLQKINLVNIGKNIIQGLVNGVGSAKDKISAAVKKLANGIPETIKKILGIHSPSRVMRDEVGFWIGEGLAQGITANTKAEKAAKGKAQAIVKSFNSDLKSLKLDFNAGKINTSQYVASLKKLKSEYKSYSTGVKTINVEIHKSTAKQASDTAKKQSMTLKERFSDDKTYYANKSKLDSTSMQKELSILTSLSKEYKKNSDERIYFENLAKQKKQEIAKQKTKIDETYYKNVKKLNEDYLASEKKLNDEYKKAVNDRATALNSFAGLFDAVNVDSNVSGKELLYNLRGQVSAFEAWRNDINELTKRGLDKGLISELQAMGPSAAAEISALTDLSSGDLSDYAQLWKQKSKLARTQALKELEPMKAQTDKKIQELKTSTATKLKEYQNVWKSSMKSVTGSAKNAANAMPNIGKLAVSNLINGMNSKKKELSTVAKEIQKIVSSVNKTASSVKNKVKSKTESTKTTEKPAPLNERVLGANTRVAATKTRNDNVGNDGILSAGDLILDIPIQIDGATFARKTVKYIDGELASRQKINRRGGR